MTFHNSHTRRNPYRKGSTFRPSYSDMQRRTEAYMDDHPELTTEEAQSAVEALQQEWVEEHA